MKEKNIKSEKDLNDGLVILKYEEEMLRETFEELKRIYPSNVSESIASSGVTIGQVYSSYRNYSKHICDAILESFLIHIRIFIEFLYGKRTPKTRKRDTDILAEDYFVDPIKWHDIIENIPDEFILIKDNLDKYLAHMSLTRKRSELDKQWNCLKLYKWITSELKLFHEKRAE